MKIGSFRNFVRKIIHMKMFRFIFSLDFATLDLCLHSRWWNAHKRTNNILRTRHSDILYLSHLLFPLFNAFEIKNFSKQRKNEPINKINCFSLIEMFAVIWKVRFHIHIMHTRTHTHTIDGKHMGTFHTHFAIAIMNIDVQTVHRVHRVQDTWVLYGIA